MLLGTVQVILQHRLRGAALGSVRPVELVVPAEQVNGHVPPLVRGRPAANKGHPAESELVQQHLQPSLSGHRRRGLRARQRIETLAERSICGLQIEPGPAGCLTQPLPRGEVVVVRPTAVQVTVATADPFQEVAGQQASLDAEP